MKTLDDMDDLLLDCDNENEEDDDGRLAIEHPAWFEPFYDERYDIFSEEDDFIENDEPSMDELYNDEL